MFEVLPSIIEHALSEIELLAKAQNTFGVVQIVSLACRTNKPHKKARLFLRHFWLLAGVLLVLPFCLWITQTMLLIDQLFSGPLFT